jgi:hypothetical protein
MHMYFCIMHMLTYHVASASIHYTCMRCRYTYTLGCNTCVLTSMHTHARIPSLAIFDCHVWRDFREKFLLTEGSVLCDMSKAIHRDRGLDAQHLAFQNHRQAELLVCVGCPSIERHWTPMNTIFTFPDARNVGKKETMKQNPRMARPICFLPFDSCHTDGQQPVKSAYLWLIWTPLFIFPAQTKHVSILSS